jgi:DNA uptake protein ComE-like DNA-binding protein
MNLEPTYPHDRNPPNRQAARRAGSILIIVLWIAFGLTAMALYFGHSMLFEFRASDQNAAGVEAEHAIEGAARYIGYFLTNSTTTYPGMMPPVANYRCEAVPVGDAWYWIIGRGDPSEKTEIPTYGLVDESSKLNINTATQDMLLALPRMTEDLAAAILEWRKVSTNTTGLADSSSTTATLYQQRNPGYTLKGGKFETVEELRLVSGADDDILYGEDTNFNGVLDPNENDANQTPPYDNKDGMLDPGILEYITVYSSDPNTRADGTSRTNVNSSQQLQACLTATLGQARAQAVVNALSGGGGPGGPGGSGNPATPANIDSMLKFLKRSRLTPDEFKQVEGDLTVTNSTAIEGLINVNTASEIVLACVPGIGTDLAPQLVAYRKGKTTNDLASISWVSEVITDEQKLFQAGPYLTTRSYQFGADIVATGHEGRGYRRTWFVFDTSTGTPNIIYRRDRARMGWALGADDQLPWLTGKELR